MRTYLYDSGITKLSEQDGQGYLLYFTGFKVTSQINMQFNSAVNTINNVVYTGSVDQMSFTPMSQHEALLQCKIDHDVEEIVIGAVQLLVDDTPFSLSIPPNQFTKTETIVDRAVGSKYFFRILINIPDLLNRVSFDNLKTSQAVFRPAASDASMPLYPWEEKADQIVLHRHSKTNTLVPVLNAWGDFWGNPLAMKMDDAGFWKIDCGVGGDGHKYTG